MTWTEGRSDHERVNGEDAKVTRFTSEIDGVQVEIEQWLWDLPEDAEGPGESYHVSFDGDLVTTDSAYDEWPDDGTVRELLSDWLSHRDEN